MPPKLPPKKDVATALLQGPSVFVHLDPRKDGVSVPQWFKKQFQLVLQLGMNMAVPIPDLDVGDEGISCTLSFNRSPFWCFLPWTAVYMLVGEDGRGMIWPEDVPPELTIAQQKPKLSVVDNKKSAKKPAVAAVEEAKETQPKAGASSEPGADRPSAGGPSADETAGDDAGAGGGAKPRPRLAAVPDRPRALAAVADLPDETAEDESAEDESIEDASAEDASAEEASAEDASAEDASAEDASAEDAPAADAADGADEASADAASADSASTDAESAESANAESAEQADDTSDAEDGERKLPPYLRVIK